MLSTLDLPLRLNQIVLMDLLPIDKPRVDDLTCTTIAATYFCHRPRMQTRPEPDHHYEQDVGHGAGSSTLHFQPVQQIGQHFNVNVDGVVGTLLHLHGLWHDGCCQRGDHDVASPS